MCNFLEGNLFYRFIEAMHNFRYFFRELFFLTAVENKLTHAVKKY